MSTGRGGEGKPPNSPCLSLPRTSPPVVLDDNYIQGKTDLNPNPLPSPHKIFCLYQSNIGFSKEKINQQAGLPWPRIRH